MSYNQEKVHSVTVRITVSQLRMLNEIAQEVEFSLSDVIRELIDRELMRRKKATDSMVPTRRP